MTLNKLYINLYYLVKESLERNGPFQQERASTMKGERVYEWGRILRNPDVNRSFPTNSYQINQLTKIKQILTTETQ